MFSIDSECVARNTGYAGECWRRGGSTIITNQPLPDTRGVSVTPQQEQGYIQQGWLADEEYATMSVKSRVFYATGIRVNGRLWGVLVLDSTDENTVPGSKSIGRHGEVLEQIALSLALLIRR